MGTVSDLVSRLRTHPIMTLVPGQLYVLGVAVSSLIKIGLGIPPIRAGLIYSDADGTIPLAASPYSYV